VVRRTMRHVGVCDAKFQAVLLKTGVPGISKDHRDTHSAWKTPKVAHRIESKPKLTHSLAGTLGRQ
jgi:hypothetical protein